MIKITIHLINYFRLIIFRNNDKWGSKNYNKVIILSEKYSLKNCSTNVLKVLKHIRYLSCVLESVPMAQNNLDSPNFIFLQWWNDNGISLHYLIWSLEMQECRMNILDWSSYYGYVNILNGLDSLGLISLLKFKFQYTSDALDLASEGGYVNVLEWWKKSNLKLKYTHKALHYASDKGYINVLKWWKKSGLKLKYDVDYVLRNDRFYDSSRLWWKSSGLIIGS